MGKKWTPASLNVFFTWKASISVVWRGQKDACSFWTFHWAAWSTSVRIVYSAVYFPKIDRTRQSPCVEREPELKQGRSHGESEGTNSAYGFLRFAHAACHSFNSGAVLIQGLCFVCNKVRKVFFNFEKVWKISQKDACSFWTFHWAAWSTSVRIVYSAVYFHKIDRTKQSPCVEKEPELKRGRSHGESEGTKSAYGFLLPMRVLAMRHATVSTWVLF